MGGCESHNTAEQDLHIQIEPRPQNHSPKQDFHPQLEPHLQKQDSDPFAPRSPRFNVPNSPATTGYSFDKHAPVQNQEVWQSQDMQRPAIGQRQAMTFGKPETSVAYKEKQMTIHSPKDEEKIYPLEDIGQGPSKLYEIRFPYGVNNAPFENRQDPVQPYVHNERDYYPKDVNVERFSLPRESHTPPKDPNAIVYEGYLLKYKPGAGFNWVERWCVLTQREFKYYKDQWSAKCWDNKPLVSIPISEIITTLRVNMNLPEFEMKKEILSFFKNRNLKQLFYFEVFDQRNEILESEGIITGNEESPYVHSDGPYNHQETYGNGGISVPIQKDHLMRPPLNQRTFRNTARGTSKSPSHRESQASSPLPRETSNRSSTSRSGLASRWNKDKNDLASWTGREKEWYYSEKRLLFATPDQEDREKWVALLEWAINDDGNGEN